MLKSVNYKMTKLILRCLVSSCLQLKFFVSRWKEAMDMGSTLYGCPMVGMIQYMPEVCQVISLTLIVYENQSVSFMHYLFIVKINLYYVTPRRSRFNHMTLSIATVQICIEELASRNSLKCLLLMMM